MQMWNFLVTIWDIEKKVISKEREKMGKNNRIESMRFGVLLRGLIDLEL